MGCRGRTRRGRLDEGEDRAEEGASGSGALPFSPLESASFALWSIGHDSGMGLIEDLEETTCGGFNNS